MAITHELVATDWTVDSANGNIRYTGHDHNGADPSYATVIEFHRWLQGLADDEAAATPDDEMYISMLSPSSRSTDNIITLINGFQVDDASIEHLYDGSIIQDAGDTIYDGITNFGNADVNIQIIQDGLIIKDDYWNYNIGATSDSGTTNTLTDTGAFVDSAWIGYTVVNTSASTRLGSKGIVASNDTNTLTFREDGELHNGASAEGFVADTYLIGQPINPDATAGISTRFMIKTRANGVDIDGRRIIGICRRMGNTYAEFKINGTSRGVNVLALVDSSDLNCTTPNTTVTGSDAGSTWETDFTGEDAGFQQFDVDASGATEDYYGKFTWTNVHDVNDLYEFVKGLTEDQTTTIIHGMVGNHLRGVTHSFGYDTETGAIAITDYDELAWGTLIDHGAIGTGPFILGEAIHEDTATPVWKGRVVALDTTNTNLVIDVESGTVGTESFTGQTSGATATSSGTPTAVTGGGVLHVLAVDDQGIAGNLYCQVTRGTMAPDLQPLYYSGSAAVESDTTDFVLVDNTSLTITSRAISTPVIGVSTGTAIIGSYGFGIDNAKLSETDLVFDLTNTAITPPNTVTNSITGGVTGNDYLLIAPTDGTTVDQNGDPTVGRAFFTLEAALSSGTTTSITVNEDVADANISAFLPATGYIDITKDDGTIVTVAYSAFTDNNPDTFTITSTDFSGGNVAAAGNYCFVGQMHITTTALTGTGVTSVEVNVIPGSTPNSGTIRIINDSGYHIRHPYSSYVDATDIFTITSAAFDGGAGTLTDACAIGNTAYVTYFDELVDADPETFQAVYDNDLNLTLVLRDGGASPIKQDIKRWSFLSSNSSLGVTRTSDT